MGLLDVLANALSGNWSLYSDSGGVAVPFDTFFSVEVANEAKATTYPTEPNGFMSYNKVQSPCIATVVVGITGTSIALSAVVEALGKLVAGTDKVSIVTPEKTFTGYTLESYDYIRTAEEGVDRLKASLRLVEVREVEAEYSNESIESSTGASEPTQASDGKTKNVGKQTPAKSSATTQKTAAKKAETKPQKKESILHKMTS